MPECIVCKAEYTVGELCPRCDSDNSAWERWKEGENKRGAPWGFLDFLKLHFYTPVIISYLALMLGLFGIAGPWVDIELSVLVPVVAFTVGMCVYIAQRVYGRRFALREEELFGRLGRGRKKEFRPQDRASLAPVVAIVVVIILGLLLVESRPVWTYANLLMHSPLPSPAGIVDVPSPEDTEPSLEDRIGRALPLISLTAYALFLVAYAYSSSLMLAREYARRLNDKVPLPIFLREDLLTEVVQREAGQFVHRTITATKHGGGSGAKKSAGAKPVSGTWTWDEMERTTDGGISFRAIVESTKTEETLSGELLERTVSTTYVVEADAWGRIIKVARAEGEKA
jgi:hypothetical protein